METLFAWLHLADLHLCFEPVDRLSPPLVPAQALQEDISRLVQSTVKPDAVLVTGDLAANGRDYDDVEAWLRTLTPTLGLEAECALAVPGNHDVWSAADQDRSIARLLQSLREGSDALDAALLDPGDQALLARRFEGFLNFAARLAPSARAGRPLCWSSVRTIRGRLVRVVGLNTALLARGDDDHGKLRVGARQLSLLEAPSGELVVALLHHPVRGGWLADERAVSAALNAHAHIALASHAHGSHATPEGVRHLMAGAIREGDPIGFSYNMAAVLAEEDGTLKLRSWPRRWSAKNGAFRTDVESVPDGQVFLERELPSRLLTTGPTRPAQTLSLGTITSSSRVDPLAVGPAAERPSGYLASIEIENIRSIKSLYWSAAPAPGWHVLIGDNGSGKSSALRAIAIVLLGDGRRKDSSDISPSPDSAMALRINFNSWLRANSSGGGISLSAQMILAGDKAFGVTSDIRLGNNVQSRSYTGYAAGFDELFSAGFGPFRRFSGGDAEYEQQFKSLPRVMRHISLFDERVSMIETLRWLKDLQLDAYADSGGQGFLAQLKSFINQDGFLPNGVRLDEIKSDVLFVDPGGSRITVEELSDGYRSILSLAMELVRQLSAHHGAEHIFDVDAKTVLAPGIVLIDEADVHLHPTWQREIGVWLKRLFPRIQFLVTTHSPLVCQAADTVFRLPRPGTDEEGRMLERIELDRLRYGNVLDAYGTGAFGRIARSDEGQKRLERLADLNRKEIELGLSPLEEREQEQLRAIFPTSKPEREARQ